MSDSIGFEAAAPGDTAGWEAQRKYKRKPVLWAAKLETASGRHECITLDLSLGGAKLRVNTPVAPHEQVALVFDRFGRLCAEVAWVDGSMIGLRFTEEPQRVSHALGGSLPL
jgi:hypothetical protein